MTRDITLVVLTSQLSIQFERLDRMASRPGTEPTEAGTASLAPSRQPQRRLTKAEAALVAERYRTGLNMNQLAAELRVHRRTIAHSLEATGVELRQSGLKPDDVRLAAELYRMGWSLARVGEKFGCSDMTVRRTLAASGVQIRPRRGGA